VLDYEISCAYKKEHVNILDYDFREFCINMRSGMDLNINVNSRINWAKQSRLNCYGDTPVTA